jgi:glycosyltransferase involved in cell wall biosynthesis
VYLKEAGCNVTVCAFEDGPLRAELQELGVPVELLTRPRHSVVLFPLFLLEMLRIRRELARLMDAYSVDVLQTHMLQVLDFLTPGLRRIAGVDVVLWTIHSVEFLPARLLHEPHWLHRLKRAGYRLCYRLLSGGADGFIAVSDGVRYALLSQVSPEPDRVFTIRNGVDLGRFARSGDKKALCSDLGLPASSTLVVTVGRLVEPKGHRYLIDSAGPVLSRFPEVHFLLIGDGELRAELEGKAARLGLSGHVHFLGSRNEVAGLLAAADLFVLPSLWEGLPVALLEAMAAAKPVVATAVAGTDEAVITGQTGLVVPPADSQALAEAISQLLSQPAQAQAMGQAARQYVESNFDAEKSAAEHVGLYRHLLKLEVGP